MMSEKDYKVLQYARCIERLGAAADELEVSAVGFDGEVRRAITEAKRICRKAIFLTLESFHNERDE